MCSIKLTFIIGSYNEVEYLDQAIQSCLGQNLDSFEIIIADDGSTDGSIDLIEKYVRDYPSIFRYFVSDRTGVCNQEVIASIRVSNCVRRALKMARGDYCLCLSGDDYLYINTFLQNAISFLDMNSEYSAYVGGYEMVWPNGSSLSCWSQYPPTLYWGGKYIHISSFVFRRFVFDSGAFLQRFCDDTGLSYSLAISGKWKYDKELVFAYRQRGDSIMHTLDRLELSVGELMLYQDVLCKGYLCWQSLSRFSKPLLYVFIHRNCLNNEKYCKYFNNCMLYDNNVLFYLYSYDKKSVIGKLKILIWIVSANFVRFYYQIVLTNSLVCKIFSKIDLV